ncbi:MAG: hypothetical protein AAGA56_21130 [Myxococcota bacterium]
MFFAPISGFWGDEALLANRVTELGVFETGIRPLASMAVTKGLVEVFGEREWAYRLLLLGGSLLVLFSATSC